MKLNFDHLQPSSLTLERSLQSMAHAELGSIDYEVFRNAVIKSFELTLETAGKLLRSVLKAYVGSPKTVDALIFKTFANIATYPRGEAPSRARRRLRHGDTVLSTVRPERGSYFLVLNPPENRVASTGFAVLTPTKVPWSFLHAAVTLPEVSDHLGQMADGGAYPAVRPEIIGAMHLALPNEPKILKAFHRLCAPLFEQADANRIQSRTLATLRDTLLPKLLSGELSAVDGVMFSPIKP